MARHKYISCRNVGRHDKDSNLEFVSDAELNLLATMQYLVLGAQRPQTMITVSESHHEFISAQAVLRSDTLGAVSTEY